MDLTTARAWVRQVARDAADSSTYSDADVDRAIQLAGNYFVVETRCTKTVSSLALTAANYNLPALPTDFREDRLMKAWALTTSDGTLHPPLVVSDYFTITEFRRLAARSAAPQALAFSSPAAAEVYPTPDVAYTLKLLWYQPFTSWTAGAVTNPTLNVPDDHLMFVLTHGARFYLQRHEPEQAKTIGVELAAFKDYIKQAQGAAAIGGQAIYRQIEGTQNAPKIQRL